MELPEGWKIVNLGDVADYLNGRAFKPTEWENTGLPIIRIQNLNKPNSNYNYTNKAFENRYKVVNGDLLFAWSASLGTYIWKGKDAWLNQHIFKVIPKGNCDKLFLFYTLENTVAELYGKAHGSGMVHITKGKFEKTKIFLPPLIEQQQIVQKIEELFSELDKGIENLKTAQEQLKVYRQAVLKWAFEGRLTNENVKDGELPEGWKWVRITDLVSSEKNSLKAGPFGSSLKKEFYVPNGYKVYGQEQVISGNPFMGDYFIDESKYQELLSNKVKVGDILISLVGTVGKVLVLPENSKEGIINPRLIKITLDQSKYIPQFFKYYFESSTVKSHYSSKAQGTTMDVLNLGIIKTIPFPFCSTIQQKKVILEIESRLSVCDKIEETITTSLQQAEALRQSILKKAFEGKLVKIDKQREEAKIISIDNNDNWQRKVLAGHIIYAFQKGGYIGRTKLQKILYLCEQHAQLDFDTHYIKEAAGPLDSRFLYAFLNEGKQKNWINETPVGNGFKYEPSTSISELTIDYPKYFRSNSDNINFVIKLLRDTDTDTAELIATVYAVWNNYIIKKQKLDDTLLTKEVYEWDDSKIKFNKSLITSTWQWMKEAGLVPVGFGTVIDKRA
ncbi:restriction endonuclease subunit S [Mucilaginibacter sp. Mucisp86]|uniref:restriction endonuclease subunit S n=1 Tax=Mucilaginibacter sp. Mucisp86 TaxID=3243060 RepID=UPI0039B4CA9F